MHADTQNPSSNTEGGTGNNPPSSPCIIDQPCLRPSYVRGLLKNVFSDDECQVSENMRMLSLDRFFRKDQKIAPPEPCKPLYSVPYELVDMG